LGIDGLNWKIKERKMGTDEEIRSEDEKRRREEDKGKERIGREKEKSIV
jgi:hypothetical protein